MHYGTIQVKLVSKSSKVYLIELFLRKLSLKQFTFANALKILIQIMLNNEKVNNSYFECPGKRLQVKCKIISGPGKHLLSEI